MGEKSVQKKQFILETDKNVFMEKGYKEVTMKDIVDACEISRGGLYLYFNSTKEIFLEVLKMEQDETDDVFGSSVPDNAAASDILALFLKEQKKELLRKKSSLTVAIYEFFFQNKVPKKDNIIRSQFDTAVKIIEHLLDEGIKNGELYCEDSLGTARNIMFVIEGLKISAQTMGITEEMVNRELLYIMRGLVVEE
jgi:AcrR family transcriptional regulator